MPPRVSAYEMISVPVALQTVLAHSQPLEPETVDFMSARGRVLAQDVFADDDLPKLPRSSVDGYAVNGLDDAEEFQVLQEITAGHLGDLAVKPGTAVRIMTGGSVPEGADAVVMVEDADEIDGRVRFSQKAKPGDNVHPPAMDLAQGQLVLASGTRIGPAEVGLLATVGATEVQVHRRPRVAVLATGDELVDPHEVPPPGSVRDSNRYGLMAAAEAAGAEIVWHGRAADTEAELEAQVLDGLKVADVLITSGGVSMGTRDLIKPLLEKIATIQFGRISFKPGKPLTFATTSEGKRVFGLPGFPVSSLVTFEVFVRPALLQLGGRRDPLRPLVEAELGFDLRSDPVRLEYQRAAVTWVDGRYVAQTTGMQASSRLLSVSGANALLQIEPGQGTLPKGSTIKALLLTDL